MKTPSLKSHVSLPRVILLMAAFFLPALAFANWTLPPSPAPNTMYIIQWSGSAPGPAVIIWALPPGGSTWMGFGSSGVVSGQASVSAGYSFSTSGLWGLRITSVDSGYTTVSLTTLYVPSSPADTSAPSIPGTPSASNISTNSLTLSWGASSDNVGVTGYQIYLNGSSYYQTSGTGTSTLISGLSSGTTYSAQVRARDAAGNWSGLSPAASITTTTAAYVYINGWTFPAHPVVNQSYPLAWQGYSSGASYVILYTRPASTPTWNSCGGGGGPYTGGIFTASGGWYPTTAGTWEFGVAPGGSLPAGISATITVY